MLPLREPSRAEEEHTELTEESPHISLPTVTLSSINNEKMGTETTVTAKDLQEEMGGAGVF